MSLYVGLGGAERHGCVTLCTDQQILGICEQERITRVRAAGFNATGLPDEVLDELLRRAGKRRDDVTTYTLAEPVTAVPATAVLRLDHHFAHACAAFLPSPFDSATVVVCDHQAPQVSVWTGAANAITRVDLPWHGLGFADLFSQCAEVLGFTNGGREQRLEALARLEPPTADNPFTELFQLDQNRLRLAPEWRAIVERRLRGVEPQQRASIAAALQSRVGDLLLEFLADVRRHVPDTRRLCVSGSLFHNSHFNSRVKLSSGFDEVRIPVNPGNAGLSVGAALYANHQARLPVSPFLGPCYTSEEIKATLDNCKLTYEWTSDTDIIAITVEALRKGRLVAWFDGSMEWGVRALGARSIVANPLAPYVLENLNRFLKQRDVWRGYALSGLESAVSQHFDGPHDSPFMECDYMPKDREYFRHVLPGPHAAVRVHTVGQEALPRFRTLLQACGEATGLPMVVNTSFNGFREPIVCSPRDAVRVFFGSGLDMLVLGQFVVSK
jgi:carbamoyltransferase